MNITALLQLVISLLLSLQTGSVVSLASQQQAIQVATQAIGVATQAIQRSQPMQMQSGSQVQNQMQISAQAPMETTQNENNVTSPVAVPSSAASSTPLPFHCPSNADCAMPPVPLVPFGSSASSSSSAASAPAITENQAIAIALGNSGFTTSSYQVAASFSGGDWYIGLTPNQPSSSASGTPSGWTTITSGGNLSYTIDGNTGAILSIAHGQ